MTAPNSSVFRPNRASSAAIACWASKKSFVPHPIAGRIFSSRRGSLRTSRQRRTSFGRRASAGCCAPVEAETASNAPPFRADEKPNRAGWGEWHRNDKRRRELQRPKSLRRRRRRAAGLPHAGRASRRSRL
jgi:hypothetical protein